MQATIYHRLCSPQKSKVKKAVEEAANNARNPGSCGKMTSSEAAFTTFKRRFFKYAYIVLSEIPICIAITMTIDLLL